MVPGAHVIIHLAPGGDVQGPEIVGTARGGRPRVAPVACGLLSAHVGNGRRRDLPMPIGVARVHVLQWRGARRGRGPERFVCVGERGGDRRVPLGEKRNRTSIRCSGDLGYFPTMIQFLWEQSLIDFVPGSRFSNFEMRWKALVVSFPTLFEI